MSDINTVVINGVTYKPCKPLEIVYINISVHHTGKIKASRPFETENQAIKSEEIRKGYTFVRKGVAIDFSVASAMAKDLIPDWIPND